MLSEIGHSGKVYSFYVKYSPLGDDGDDGGYYGDGDDDGDDGDDGDGNDGVEVIFGPVRRINDVVSRSGPRSIISSCVITLAK